MLTSRTFTVAVSLGLALLSSPLRAQTTPVSPAPQTNTPVIYPFMAVGYTCGVGASTSKVSTLPTVQCGALMNLGLISFEGGVVGPVSNQGPISAYLGLNVALPLIASYVLTRSEGFPMFVAGYTRFFQADHTLNYGAAFVHPTNSGHAIQFEVRDYRPISYVDQHNVVFRVIWLTGLSD